MYYCNTCQTKFQALASISDEINDEEYSFCPNCKSDDYREGSGIEKPKHQIFIEQRKDKAFDVETWRAKKEAEERAQDERIRAYQEVYETQGPEAAAGMYFSNYNPVAIAHHEIKLNAIIITPIQLQKI
jgi:hypothetical protein